jgi:hypothetical protein
VNRSRPILPPGDKGATTPSSPPPLAPITAAAKVARGGGGIPLLRLVPLKAGGQSSQQVDVGVEASKLGPGGSTQPRRSVSIGVVAVAIQGAC